MGLDILAAYDGSAHGDRALEYACQLGSWNEGSVTAVYAVQPDIYDAAKSDGLSNLSEEYRRQVLETIDEAERRGQELLERAETVAAETDCERIDTTLVYGDPANEIVAYAEKNAFDTIVVGHREREERPAFPIGSVAQAIIERASVPVTVTR